VPGLALIRLVATAASGQPARWVLAFQRSTESRLVNWLAFGRYKHVTAFGYVEAVDHWLFFDWRARALDLIVARGEHATQLMAHYTRDADLLGMDARPGAGTGFQAGLWCVPAIRHLVGIRGSALRPDALWRDCIAQGAEILSHEQDARPSRDHGRSDAAAAGAAGAAG
jgi:hypothetical protein